jgi:hypothetical protein
MNKIKGQIGSFFVPIVQLDQNINFTPISYETNNKTLELSPGEQEEYNKFLFNQYQDQMKEYEKQHNEYELYMKNQQLDIEQGNEIFLEGQGILIFVLLLLEFLSIYKQTIDKCLSHSHHYRRNKNLSDSEVNCMKNFVKKLSNSSKKIKKVFLEKNY